MSRESRLKSAHPGAPLAGSTLRVEAKRLIVHIHQLAVIQALGIVNAPGADVAGLALVQGKRGQIPLLEIQFDLIHISLALQGRFSRSSSGAVTHPDTEDLLNLAAEAIVAKRGTGV